jgi:hypothetical protein
MVIWYISPRVGMLYKEKSGNPVRGERKSWKIGAKKVVLALKITKPFVATSTFHNCHKVVSDLFCC